VKKVNFLISLSVLFFTEQLIARNNEHHKQESHHTQEPRHDEQSENHDKNKKHHEKDANKSKSHSELEKLIQDFTKSTEKIKGSCRSKSKQKKDTKEDRSEHFKSVDRSYEAYKKIDEHMKKNHNMTITKEQDQKVKRSAEKLFECKNVQHMPWKPHVQGKSNHKNK